MSIVPKWVPSPARPESRLGSAGAGLLGPICRPGWTGIRVTVYRERAGGPEWRGGGGREGGRSGGRGEDQAVQVGLVGLEVF